MSLFPYNSGPVVCFGELLLRLGAPRGELLEQARALDVHVGGAEANVAASLARLGHAASFVSTVPDNPLGRHARDVLRSHGVDVAALELAPATPTHRVAATQDAARALPAMPVAAAGPASDIVTGRMGLYFLTPGAGNRAADIIYDRAGSAFALRPAASYDWDELLAGAGWLHVSGINAAVSDEAARATLDAVQTARRLGVLVSFDGNYRAKLWAARGEDGAVTLAQILACADLAFIDQRDIALLLNDTQLAQGEQTTATLAAFHAFPTLQAIACSTRRQHSIDHHELSAALYTRNGINLAPARQINGIIDRIGTGDAFAAGFLHGLLRGWQEPDTLTFALAAACAKHSIVGDIHPLDEAQILQSMEGKPDVCR